MSPGTRESVQVIAAAMATVLLAEALLKGVSPLLPGRMEAEDGIEQVRRGDPEILLIGSSHGRSFVRIAEVVERTSGGRRQMAVVPLEYGKTSSYEWLLNHRLRPLLEEATSDGRHARANLRRFVLVTEWWDACSPSTKLADNVPGRGFAIGDFVADVGRRGLNSWNQNYIDYKWNLLFRGSILVQDRGVGRIVGAAKAWLGRPSYVEDAANRLGVWQAMSEGGATDPLCHDGRERAALERILDWAHSRSLDVTIVLFPRKPETLTPKARATTIAAFSEEMRAFAERRGIRFVDYTTSTPIADEDFMSDFDHLNDAGNEKFTRWALEGELRFLLEPPDSRQPGARTSAP